MRRNKMRKKFLRFRLDEIGLNGISLYEMRLDEIGLDEMRLDEIGLDEIK